MAVVTVSFSIMQSYLLVGDTMNVRPMVAADGSLLCAVLCCGSCLVFSLTVWSWLGRSLCTIYLMLLLELRTRARATTLTELCRIGIQCSAGAGGQIAPRPRQIFRASQYVFCPLVLLSLIWGLRADRIKFQI